MNKNNYYSTDYLELKKSPLTPPNYVFGIVWPILYTMMGISALLVFNKCNKLCLPLIVFMIHGVHGSMFACTYPPTLLH